MKKLLLSLAMVAGFTGSAFAYDFSGCQVVEIILAGENNGHVRLNCQITNIPACASANNYLGFDKTTTGGKQYLAMLTLAHMTNGKIEGSVDHNACATYQTNVPALTGLRLVLNQ